MKDFGDTIIVSKATSILYVYQNMTNMLIAIFHNNKLKLTNFSNSSLASQITDTIIIL